MNNKNLGQLAVVAYKAKDLPNREIVGKQDPFVVFRIGDITKRTKTDHRGGQHPVWDDQVNIPIDGKKKILTVQVYDEDAKREELISECEVDLSEVMQEGEMDAWFPLLFKSKPAGEIYLEMTFYAARPPPQRQPTRYGKNSRPQQTYGTPLPTPISHHQPYGTPVPTPVSHHQPYNNNSRPTYPPLSESQSAPTTTPHPSQPPPQTGYSPFHIQASQYPPSTSTPAFTKESTHNRLSGTSYPFNNYPAPNKEQTNPAKPVSPPRVSQSVYPRPSSSSGTPSSNLMTPTITTMSNGLQHIQPPQLGTYYNQPQQSRPTSMPPQGSGMFDRPSSIPPQGSGMFDRPSSIPAQGSGMFDRPSSTLPAPLLSSSYTPHQQHNNANGYALNNGYPPYPPSNNTQRYSIPEAHGYIPHNNALGTPFAAHQGSYRPIQQPSFTNNGPYQPSPNASGYNRPNYGNGYPPY